jgi:hypothetical protein
MNPSMNSTLAATLIATAAGLGVWLSGLTKAVWPAHPQIAAILITIAVSILVKMLWPANAGQKHI